MGDWGSAILLFSAPAAFLWWVWTVVYAVWWKPTKLGKMLKQQGIAGPPYKLLYGNLLDNVAFIEEARSKPMELSHKIVPRVSPYLHHIFETYGKRSMFWFGRYPRVQLRDPELIKEVLSNKFGHFKKPEPNPLVKLFGNGVALQEGEKWARHRRILNPAFHLEKIKRMLPAFAASCAELTAKWEELVGAEGGSAEVDVWLDLQNLTADVISRTAFGSNYREGNRIFKLQAEQAALMIQAGISVYFPGLEFLPTKKNRRRKEIHGEVKSLLTGMIKKREKAMKAGEAAPDDMLGLMLQSNSKEAQEHGISSGMTMEDVIEECKLFYLAGQETTSVLLTWTMIVLGMHPDWQSRAREEVLQVFGRTKPAYDGLSHLKIVNMILHEVLRLYPPVTLITRKTYKEMKLGGITVPAGVELAMPILFVHHDKEIWGKDADEFNPERFVGGISKASKHQAAFFPFGGGPRICIGMNFALTEAKLALAGILQSFWFELSLSYTHAPMSVLTMQPQYGAQIVLHKL